MMLDRTQKNTGYRQARLLLAVFGVGLISACSSSIKITADIPEPLVERLPITAKVSYSDSFKQYKYEEKEKSRALKSLDFGAAQTSMFDKIFDRLLTLVSDDEAADLNIEPEILDFQYTAPRETKLKLYEVWLRYRLKLTDKDNNKLADWTIKGYGKTPTGSLTSATTAFNAATNVALRDVGAQLSTRMPTQSVIKPFLAVDEDGDAQISVAKEDEHDAPQGNAAVNVAASPESPDAPAELDGEEQ